MSDENGEIVIRLEARPEFEKVYLRVPSDVAAETKEALGETGAKAGEVMEFALDPGPIAIGVVVAPGLWLSLRAVIQALGARNKDKTFRLELSGEGSIEANGHSAGDIDKILKSTQELYAAREEQTRRVGGGS
ncbi:hypothetical protein [Streptomyces sp. NBC_01602]|uniref:hypothetical protein n=1 Tax=Streptomyces sp. NBC_01602 TaxID=2975893 RepID=UPI00386C8862